MSTSSIKTLNCLPALPADGKKKLSTLIEQHSGIFEVRLRKVGKGQIAEVRLREQNRWLHREKLETKFCLYTIDNPNR